MYYRGAMFWTFIVVVELQTFQFMMSQMKRERVKVLLCYSQYSDIPIWHEIIAILPILSHIRS